MISCPGHATAPGAAFFSRRPMEESAMKKNLQVLVMAVALSSGANVANAQQSADHRVADLVRAGKVRGALFLPQYTTDPATGELRGAAGGIVMIALARSLASHLGIEVLLVGHPTPDKATECLKADRCDVALGMGIDPTREAEVDFSPPYMELDFSYLVLSGSSIQSVADADRPGVRIAAVRNHASTLALSRILKHAELVYADTPETTFDLLRAGHADAFAQARPVLLEYSSRLAGSRVLQERYGAYLLAMALPKGKAERLAYIAEFIEQAKASGLVQRAIEQGGLRGVQVASPANSTTR
jgi:polar amino acid transport system substrate-binding protein